MVVGLQIEQNVSKDDPDLYFVRISVSEVQLMEAAAAMPLDKRLKVIINIEYLIC